MIQKNKQDEEKGGVNPVFAAVTGAILGAGVAIAGAVALKNEKNRKKVKEVLGNVRDQAMGYMESMHKQADDKKGQVDEKLADSKEKIKKIKNLAKKAKEVVSAK